MFSQLMRLIIDSSLASANGVLSWLKRVWSLLLPVLFSVLIIDWASALIAIHHIGVMCLGFLFLDFLFDNREGWGLFTKLSMDDLVDSAKSSPIGSAIIFLGYVVITVTVLILIMSSSASASQMPVGANKNLPVLSEAIQTHWPQAVHREIMAGQVEQESSWKEKATLRTSRELGRGLVQLTITKRFNAYTDAVRMKALKDWNWQLDPYNPKYQLTYLVLRDRDTFHQMSAIMANDQEAWRAALVCYNAGSGRVLARRLNAKLMNLPANIWKGGLDQAHGPKEDVMLYGRPLWQAVNEYPVVIFKKSEKYVRYFNE